MNPTNSQTLYVRVLSPKEDIFAGNAGSVSSTNSKGPFDVLPQHANFITLVQNPILIRKTNKEVLTFNFPLAIIHVKDNKVNIYTEIQ